MRASAARAQRAALVALQHRVRATRTIALPGARWFKLPGPSVPSCSRACRGAIASPGATRGAARLRLDARAQAGHRSDVAFAAVGPGHVAAGDLVAALHRYEPCLELDDAARSATVPERGTNKERWNDGEIDE